MKKRILSIVLTLCMVLMLVPQAVFAANDDATALQSLLNGGGIVTLSKNYTIDTTLNVTNTVTLDLKGYTISMTGSGSVIKVGGGGNLTLQDSSAAKTGVITGGNADKGGGVYVNGGSFTLNSGTIANCSASDGGGVFNNGSFTMNGGTIANCSTSSDGGGVRVYSNSSMTLNGGAIQDCSATRGGGVFNSGSFTMEGGTIANCSATTTSPSYGGGVYDAGSSTMSGGVIENCRAASSSGGGVLTNRAFSMSGGATIRGCSAKYGGGVFINLYKTMTMNGGTIEDCTSTNDGKSDAVRINNNASLLANGGTIKGTVETGSYGAIQNTSTGGCTVFYDAVTNNGTISGGVYYGGIVNKSAGTVSGTYRTVTFDLNGGSGSAPTQWFVNIDTATALKPADSTNDAYNTFVGWYNGDTAYDFTKAVTESIKLTAKYSDPKTYNISYDLNGGTATNPTSYTVESDAITLTNPTKPGYTFTGWSGTDLSSNTMIVTIPKGSTGERLYTANWRDSTAPVISGIEDGKTYCNDVECTVSDNDGIESVKVNNVELTATNGKYTLEKGTGTVTVVARDNAGNETTLTVTVNNGHTADNDDGDCTTPVYCIYHPDTIVIEAKYHDFSGDWNKDTDGHWHICQNEGCAVTDPPIPHSGGTAICTAKAECEYCGEEYGGLDSSNHTGGTEIRGTKDATCTEEGYTGDTYCLGCGEKISAGTAIKMSAHNLEKVPAKGATDTETGNTEYWHCKDCGKYFADENGTKEIKLEDTVIAVNAWAQTVLRLQSTASKTSIKLKWNAVPEADGYVIYWNKCGSKSSCKQVKVIEGGKPLTWTHKGLKKGSWNRYYVKAYKVIDGKKTFIKTSNKIHLTTKGGTYTNVKKLKASTSSVTLKKGKTKTLKIAQTYAEKNKKPTLHMRPLTYSSSDKAVATVTSKGLIKAKGTGSCYIYITAYSGVYTRVKVTVK